MILNHHIHGNQGASPPAPAFGEVLPCSPHRAGAPRRGATPKATFGVVQLAVGSGLGDGWRKEPHVCMGAPKITPSCAAYTVNRMAAVGTCTCGGTWVCTNFFWGKVPRGRINNCSRALVSFNNLVAVAQRRLCALCSGRKGFGQLLSGAGGHGVGALPLCLPLGCAAVPDYH